MRNSRILSRIREGKPARIAMLGHFVPPFIAHAASAGYDGVWLDLEHRAFDAREVQALLLLTHLYDIDGLVRPPTREKTGLYRHFEDGATGLVLPLVHTADEARGLVRAVKFPPLGDRGTNGWGLETSYAVDTGGRRDALIAHALRETFVLMQVESPEALANLEQIVSVPGVDGIFVGPEDLRIRMQHAPEHLKRSESDAMAHISAVCNAHGKAWGSMAATPDDLAQLRKLGASLLLWGVDVAIVRDALQHAAQVVNAIS